VGRKTDVLTFGTFWDELRALAGELRARGVTHVAMEASGVCTDPVSRAWSAAAATPSRPSPHGLACSARAAASAEGVLLPGHLPQCRAESVDLVEGCRLCYTGRTAAGDRTTPAAGHLTRLAGRTPGS
jgi:hypothetical protein